MSTPRLVLVHGSAADRATWTIQLSTEPLKSRFDLVAMDRRVGGSVADHALEVAGWGRAFVVGSSFGAVVALEHARTRPDLALGVILCEPPLPPSDDAPPVPAGMLEELDGLARSRGGPAAAEKFLRTVLGDVAFEKMPKMFRARAMGQWPQIRGDCAALAAYRVRYHALGDVQVPALLLGGDRSAAYFRPTLEALAAALPRARLEVVAGAGHMMHADAPRGFADAVIRFVDSVVSIG